ncbi:MAG TPA: helix-turn-helix domain-containing protein [Acidimicrobiales bacterium]|nr:helix-turn-helix domain-containing protein [Acidimicrobiales bacterium]
MMRHRGADARTPGDPREEPTPSPADIGRVLRDKREEIGLDLLTVHDRLGRPITQLEALEAGDLSRLHNQAFALSTLRRYARFLALDGDALALQFMESLSVVVAAPTGVVGAVDSEPDHLRAFTQTGPVPRVGGAGFNGAGWGQAGPPTGTLAVVPREQIKETRKIQRKVRHTRQAPMFLRVLTWLVLVLLLVALAGVGIRHWRPQLLVQWHIAPANGALYLPPPATTSPTTHPTTPVAAVKLASTDNLTTATYTVSAPTFDVVLTTTAPCYVEVTSPASVNPIVEDVQPANVTKSYSAQGSLTVVVGAAEVSISVLSKGKKVFTTVPQYAPFSYTFNSVPAG